MSDPELVVERLSEYSPEAAADLGRLMPHLSERMGSEPISEELLRAIIDSPHHEQIVARLDGVVVGAATMSLIMGPCAGRKGELEDFVTSPEVRGHGIGDKIWQEMLKWCQEQGINFGFTSRPSREAAHRFYKDHRATVRDTTVFQVNVD
ncbi:MAG TPA: GNAT family N-acetyltransferase [Candidatus Saccharimonadales bacterium]|jgi:GNAT superfamily N-acetyltransferase|nr:GNAT family N-acetyltransferase [Candidatus Saccharimonadales bacterium]